MTLKEFQDKALEQFTREITDIFFSYIENDSELMHDYLRIVGRENDLDTTNRKLGEAVKNWFRPEVKNISPEDLLNYCSQWYYSLFRSFTHYFDIAFFNMGIIVSKI